MITRIKPTLNVETSERGSCFIHNYNRTPIEMLGYHNYSELSPYLFVEVLQCEEDIPDNECDCGLWESVGEAACIRR